MSKKSAAKAIAAARTDSPPLDIVRMRLEDLVLDPKNARSHPEENKRAIRRSLIRFGQVEPLVVRAGTNVVIGGNGRLEEMRELEWDDCDVVVRDLTDDEATALGIALNRSGELAAWNRENLSAILPDLPKDLWDVVGVTALAKHVKIPLLPADVGSLIPMEPLERLSEPVIEFRNNPVFSSSNEWGIPDLLPDMFFDRAPTHTWRKHDTEEERNVEGGLPLHIMSYSASDLWTGGVIGFYTQDKRFEVAWNKTTDFTIKMLAMDVAAAVQPDFSQYGDDPIAVQVWNAYRSRWCARYFQEAGVALIPSVPWNGNKKARGFTRELTPKDAPVVAMQVRTSKNDTGKAMFIEELRYLVEEIKPRDVILYGGSLHRLWLDRFVTSTDDTTLHYLKPASPGLDAQMAR